MKRLFSTLTKISPEQFEMEIQNQIRTLGINLQDFDVKRREKIAGSDGEYEIDVLAKFEALGGNFVVLIECKHHKNSIKREVVQVLNDRLRSTGAQKGMIFSTAGFQSGAIEYAKKNGIALVKVEEGKNSYFVRDFYGEVDYPDWLPEYAFWLVSISETGQENYSKIHEKNPEKLLRLFEARET
jgi:restriction system protein